VHHQEIQKYQNQNLWKPQYHNIERWWAKETIIGLAALKENLEREYGEIKNNQSPSINHQTIPNDRIPKQEKISAILCLVIEYWVLVIIWSLVIGDWLFPFTFHFFITLYKAIMIQ